MNILVMQLGRFGDIYQTWPILNALRRKYPQASLHVLVRERFRRAMVGYGNAQVHILPTSNILEPLLRERSVDEVALDRLSEFIDDLKKVRWDYVVNLSFSPSSSYLVDLIGHEGTVVSGYSRTNDGFLNIADDASAYFYAQVGVGRANRIHICDLFALVSAVDLETSDFQFGPFDRHAQTPPGTKYLVVHLGASQEAKSVPPAMWVQFLYQMREETDFPIVLIGTEKEKLQTLQHIPGVIDLCGETQIDELFNIIAHAELVIGADSVAVQVASLTNTPTLNISFSTVNFWETGPRASHSRVLWFSEPSEINVSLVAAQASSMMDGHRILKPCILREEGFGVIYSLHGYLDDDAAWELTRSLYMQTNVQLKLSQNAQMGLHSLNELALLGLEHLPLIYKDKTRPLAMSVLNEVDALMDQILSGAPELGPVVRWFQTEKSRIQPGDVQKIIDDTTQVFRNLKNQCEKLMMNKVFSENSMPEAAWK